MKKIKLTLNQLKVDSFEITASNSNKGTINGLGLLPSREIPCESRYFTCEGITCETCVQKTCDGYTEHLC